MYVTIVCVRGGEGEGVCEGGGCVCEGREGRVCVRGEGVCVRGGGGQCVCLYFQACFLECLKV